MNQVLRVMFVDDDVNLLEGMRRSLRAMRHEWHMQFLPSGAEALAALAGAPVDVLVSDMRMPGMDGCELLTRVKALYPQTARIVLSGYAEQGAIMRLVGTAHQYISKPGESAALKAAIAQVQFMRELLGNADLIQLVGQVGTLPSVPSAFDDLTSCLRQPNANVNDAARIILRDVAMTANIMKLVNSAFFGARHQVTSVERAIAYVGWDTLTALVLGHGLFKSGGPGTTETLWTHSLHTALAARAIARCEGFCAQQIEEAFLTGMLHDVGRVVFATRDAVRGDDPAPTSDEDLQRHAEVGAYLLGLWGFSSRMVAAVARHDHPSRRMGADLDLTVLIHLADRLSHACASQGSQPPALEVGLLEQLGMTDRLPRWQAAINDGEAQYASEEVHP